MNKEVEREDHAQTGGHVVVEEVGEDGVEGGVPYSHGQHEEEAEYVRVYGTVSVERVRQ